METKKIEIYSTPSSSSGRLVTPFWKEKYERDAKKYWDVFYRRHQDKFFKDRHYLHKEWGEYFQVQEGEKLIVLEVGCGAGNTVFPLLSTYPNIFVHACDFSPRAIDLVKQHKDFSTDQINAFVCDLTVDNLSDILEPSSVDLVTMIFVLSAVAPEKMSSFLQNIKPVLKQNGRVLFRDYAYGDLAQERLTSKGQQISENFYVRGDGTRAYYFSEEFLTNLFMENGFELLEIGIHNKQLENRSLELVMNRSWIQAVFSVNSIKPERSINKEKTENCNGSENYEINLSEEIGNMFDMSHTTHDIIEIKVKGNNFKIKAMAKENQHTCKSTGLILWESARFMSNVLAENPKIVTGKRVLELGCGSAGLCSMVSANHNARIVVATDGDAQALDLLRENISTNFSNSCFADDKLCVRNLVWGSKEDVESIKGHFGKFDVIIGTDVTYNFEAIGPLFDTARELIADYNKEMNNEMKPELILCHIQRRVDHDSIVSAGILKSFTLADKWINGVDTGNGTISSWICGADLANFVQNAPLTVLLFHV